MTTRARLSKVSLERQRLPGDMGEKLWPRREGAIATAEGSQRMYTNRIKHALFLSLKQEKGKTLHPQLQDYPLPTRGIRIHIS